MKRFALLAVFGATMAAAALHTPVAHADEGSYVYAIENHGVPATMTAIRLGHEVCGSISQYGVNGIIAEVNAANASGVDSHTSATIIVSAVYQLCPSNMPYLDAWLGDTSET